MDFKTKKQKFKNLERKIRLNVIMIQQLKKIVFWISVIFFISFLVFIFFNSFSIVNSLIQVVVNVFLVVTFLFLFGINLLIKKKELENKKLDVKIYKLLKLDN